MKGSVRDQYSRKPWNPEELWTPLWTGKLTATALRHQEWSKENCFAYLLSPPTLWSSNATLWSIPTRCQPSKESPAKARLEMTENESGWSKVQCFQKWSVLESKPIRDNSWNVAFSHDIYIARYWLDVCFILVTVCNFYFVLIAVFIRPFKTGSIWWLLLYLVAHFMEAETIFSCNFPLHCLSFCFVKVR